ncbi:MAG: SMC-Scp complex subunit ScpB [Candidatus Omnitrophica bacterium]|nr:SMC-Scp complex subunit ScpB [Candidatus Omnitrophota bacterium]
MNEHAQSIIEALLFVSESPVSAEQIGMVLEDLEPSEIRSLIEALKKDYEGSKRSLVIQEVAGGYQMTTNPLYAPWLRKFLKKTRGEKLSGPSLETLAIVAYKQPVTRQEIEFIRGVNVEGVLKSLLEKRLIRIAGRKEIIGRPLLYGTSREFLEYFGLNSLEELPPLEEFVQQSEKMEEAALPQEALSPSPEKPDESKEITS